MGSVVLVLLAVAWGVVLVPKLLERRSDRGSSGSEAIRAGLALLHARRSGSGRTSLSMGGSMGGRGLYSVANPQARVAQHRARRAAKRRRDVFFVLFGSALGSAVVAMVPGFAIVWKVHLLLDVLLLGYVALLVSQKQNSPAVARRGAVAPRRTSADFGYANYDEVYDYAYASNE